MPNTAGDNIRVESCATSRLIPANPWGSVLPAQGTAYIATRARVILATTAGAAAFGISPCRRGLSSSLSRKKKCALQRWHGIHESVARRATSAERSGGVQRGSAEPDPRSPSLMGFLAPFSFLYGSSCHFSRYLSN